MVVFWVLQVLDRGWSVSEMINKRPVIWSHMGYGALYAGGAR
jgi:hypothetical protein